jgi:ABC transport system ATP-binding/permease protein
VSVVLDVRGLRKSYGAQLLFDGVEFSISDGEKVGLIGRNGTGKSTLFRVLAGEEEPDAGTIALRRGVQVGYLSQDPAFDPDRTVFQAVGAGRGELQRVLGDYRRVTQALSGGSGSSPGEGGLSALLERQGRLSARIDELGGWDWQHRVEAILTRLGVEEWERLMGSLSGGERRRVALARTLLTDPDLLLLDEPTNHLDADTVLWLEETLFDFPGAALVITHDRYFLDRVVDRMLELSPVGLAAFDGGYTEYLEERAAREEREQVEEGKRQRLLEKELAWARRSPPARTGKQKARRARAQEMAGEQRARDRDRVRRVEMEVQEAPRLGRTVLEARAVGKSFGDRVIIRDFSERLQAGERVGIVGPNGAGKTTLLRILMGEEAPDSGEVVLGENTRFAYLDQLRALDPELSVARAVSEQEWVELGGRRIHIRGYLDRFLFPAHVQEQKVRSLSGGERNRILLARLFLQEANLLVLDEPTNDLDLDTLRVLEERIEEFPGCLLLVTHDRFLLDKVATSLLVFEGEGRVHRHHGSWDRYLARRESERAEAARDRKEAERRERELRAEAARTQAREARAGARKLSYREQQELQGIPARLAELEAEKEGLGARLAEPDLYQGTGDEVPGLTRRFREVEAELEALYERWMELEERAR